MSADEHEWMLLGTHHTCSACGNAGPVRQAWLGRLMMRLCRPCLEGLREVIDAKEKP